MWFDPQAGPPDWSPALRHLLKVDPVLKKAIKVVGPCTLAPRTDGYETLVLSIFNQQLSVKGAVTLYGRFRDRFTRKQITPRKVLAALHGPRAWDDETIRHCGISRQKRAYLIDLSRHVIDGRLPLDGLGDEPDDVVIERLTAVKGIGEWTAQMFLMFTLCRPDVLPILDLGLQDAVKLCYGLAERPKPKELLPRAEPWRPWRTVATWYLWRAKEG